MRERTLLERLRQPESEGSRRASADVGALTRSILAHLARMFNTRQGHALTALDYGMPDMTDFMREFPSSAEGMERAIRESIERYEPRLKSLRVRLERSETDALKLTFRLTAKLALEKQSADVAFAMNVNSEGQFEIRP
ncbi:MAG TPA: type VI secretion system baseplate subunit TssE [Candidatus Polarisedimenticolia bacterium]|nr:type VI secretion system baseplate subunit TssE [Candidatus Polarisedimenticolia bacterium]